MNDNAATYWHAFFARLWATGIPCRSVPITGNEERLRRVNEFLRELNPDLADDAVAVAWLNENRSPLMAADDLREQFYKTADAAGFVRPPLSKS